MSYYDLREGPPEAPLPGLSLAGQGAPLPPTSACGCRRQTLVGDASAVPSYLNLAWAWLRGRSPASPWCPPVLAARRHDASAPPGYRSVAQAETLSLAAQPAVAWPVCQRHFSMPCSAGWIQLNLAHSPRCCRWTYQLLFSVSAFAGSPPSGSANGLPCCRCGSPGRARLRVPEAICCRCRCAPDGLHASAPASALGPPAAWRLSLD